MGNDQQEVLDAVGRYVNSINHAEDPALVDALWEQSEGASNINPRGQHHGFAEIKNGFYPPLVALLSQRRLEIQGKPSVYIFDNTALATFSWKLEATKRDDGAPVNMEGRETQVYRKKDGVWKLVHLHYSGMPVAGF